MFLLKILKWFLHCYLEKTEKKAICATESAVVMVSLDISAAFNTINNLNMLHILEDYFHFSEIASFCFILS